jgi:hypothetical protein
MPITMIDLTFRVVAGDHLPNHPMSLSRSTIRQPQPFATVPARFLAADGRASDRCRVPDLSYHMIRYEALT